LQRLFNLRHARGVKYSLRCSAAPELQKRMRILNASAGIMFIPGTSSFSALKTLYQSIRAGQLDRRFMKAFGSVAAHPGSVTRPVLEYVFARRTYTPNATCRLGITTEQEPNPASQVRLSTERDSLGMPKMLIEWRLTDASWHTVSTFVRAVQTQFERAGLGTIVLDDWFSTPGAWKEKLGDHYHHIGTTRMHTSPDRGVVNAHCQVHGIENLYVGSSAVFPTGGHSNPTFTIIALCIRIADRLRRTARDRAAPADTRAHLAVN
jgi:choline dehydrogenase-like flavoprotein